MKDHAPDLENPGSLRYVFLTKITSIWSVQTQTYFLYFILRQLSLHYQKGLWIPIAWQCYQKDERMTKTKAGLMPIGYS